MNVLIVKYLVVYPDFGGWIVMVSGGDGGSG